MTVRADPLGIDTAGSEQGLDLRGFRPRKAPPKIDPVEIRQVAESAAFPSREATNPEPSHKRVERRVYRTGRNAHLSMKADPRVIDQFYSICNRENLVMGETLRLAVEALERELANRAK